MDEIQLDALRKRAERAVGDRPVQEAIVQLRAIIGPTQIPASEIDASNALKKLRNGDIPTAIELAALEIVVRMLRPAPLSIAGKLADLPTRAGQPFYPPPMIAQWDAFRKTVEPFLPSIGIVLRANAEHVGSGFVVKEGVLATNRHVLDVLSFGSGTLTKGQATVSFDREHDTVGTASGTVDIVGVIATDDVHDIALLQLQTKDRSAVPLDPTVKVGAADDLVVIGYPSEDRLNNPLFLSAVFRGKFGVKRASLGEALSGTASPQIFHDCSTAAGNSGSPVFSLQTGKVVGVHRAGFFMYRNEAIDRSVLASLMS